MSQPEPDGWQKYRYVLWAQKMKMATIQGGKKKVAEAVKYGYEKKNKYSDRKKKEKGIWNWAWDYRPYPIQAFIQHFYYLL